jgi:hypothetical protein
MAWASARQVARRADLGAGLDKPAPVQFPCQRQHTWQLDCMLLCLARCVAVLTGADRHFPAFPVGLHGRHV